MKGIIFDMDGVLVDVTNSYDKTIKMTVDFFLGGDISLSSIYKTRDLGGFNNDWNLTDEILKNNNRIISKKRIISKFQDLYLNRFVQFEKWLLKKNILIQLKKHFKLGIVTGRPRSEALYSIKKNKMDGFFNYIIAMEDVKYLKPDPEGLINIKKKLSIETGYYIGDTIDDMKAAVLANLIPIGLVPPKNFVLKENQMKKYGARKILNNINKIMEILDEK